MDITGLNDTEDTLEEENHRIQTYLDLAEVIFLVINIKEEVAQLNMKGCEVLGYEKEEIIGKNWFDNFLPERLVDEAKSASRSWLTGRQTPPEYCENRVITKYGEERLIAWHNTILRNGKKKIMGYASLGEDITERRRAEAVHRSLIDHSLQGLAILQDARIVFANKTLAEKTGYTSDELLSLSPEEVYEIIYHEDRESILERFRKRIGVESVTEQCEFRFVRKDGMVCWAEVNASLTEYDGRPAVQAVCIDITDRKRAEQVSLEKEKKIKQQTQRLRELNFALKVILEHLEQEKKGFDSNIVESVHELIFPYIEKLENGGLDEKNRTFLKIIKANMEGLVSPFAKTLSSKTFHLTPTETQIADLVRQGKTSKEIASLLDVSLKAIDFHRSNLRRKLGLQHKKANLRSHLDSFVA